MLGLFELSDVSHKSLMLLIWAFFEYHCATCDRCILPFGLLLAQFPQFDFIVLILLLFFLTLFVQIFEHQKVIIY